MHAPLWWDRLVEVYQRSNDERMRAIQVSAAKDAFLGLSAALMLSLVLAPALPEQWQRIGFVALPLLVLAVGSIVYLVSYRLRGGGYEPPVANTKIAVTAVAFAIGFLLFIVFLAVSGQRISPVQLAGQLLGAALAIVVIAFVLRRGR